MYSTAAVFSCRATASINIELNNQNNSGCPAEMIGGIHSTARSPTGTGMGKAATNCCENDDFIIYGERSFNGGPFSMHVIY